jgi:hypothetical protein
VTHSDRYAHDCTDVAAVKDGGALEYMYHDRTAWCFAFFVSKKYGFAAGFQGLVKRWDKCLNLYGDYVEE